MKLLKHVILTLLLLGFFLSACSNNDVVDTPNNNQPYEVVASDYTIQGILKSKDYTSSPIKLVEWKNGKGTLVATLGADKDIAVGIVKANGEFSITLPGKMKEPNLIQYIPIGGGSLVGTPSLFWTTYVHLIFYFKPDNNDESLERLVAPVILDENLISIKNFGYIFTGTAAKVTGISANGQVKYNSQYQKGWNLEAWENVNNVTEYSVINQLPAMVIWK